jgi:hypothetical protein
MKNYYYISTGDLNGFYTLKHRFDETIYVRSEGYEQTGAVEAQIAERDQFIKNLSTDKDQALVAANAWLDEHGVDPHRRRLDIDWDLSEIQRRSAEALEAEREREAERIRTTDWSILPFGKYAGKSLRDLVTTDPEYVSFVATWDSGDGQHCAKVAAELIAPYLAAKNAAQQSECDKIISAFSRSLLEIYCEVYKNKFAGSVSKQILSGNKPSDRAIDILIEIAAKEAGRSYSKKWKARYQEIVDALAA